MTSKAFAARVLLFLLFCLLIAAPLEAGEARLYVSPYFESSQLTGDGKVAGGSAGTDFNLEDDLGVDPTEGLAGVDAFVKFFGQRVQFSYYQDKIEGRKTLGDELVFDGTSFLADEKVETRLDLKRYELLYGFDIGLKVVNLGFLAGAQLIDVEAAVSSNAGASENESLQLPLPVVGSTLGIHPTDNWAIHAKLSGMSANVSGYSASVLDAALGVDYLFVSRFGVSLGFRAYILDLTDEKDDNNINLDQTGPYIGLSLHL